MNYWIYSSLNKFFFPLSYVWYLHQHFVFQVMKSLTSKLPKLENNSWFLPVIHAPIVSNCLLGVCIRCAIPCFSNCYWLSLGPHDSSSELFIRWISWHPYPYTTHLPDSLYKDARVIWKTNIDPITSCLKFFNESKNVLQMNPESIGRDIQEDLSPVSYFLQPCFFPLASPFLSHSLIELYFLW